MTIRILLTEEQTMVRGALAALLSLEADMEIVAEVSCGDDVLPTALVVLPDVALLDIEMLMETVSRRQERSTTNCRSVAQSS